ncbi:hypothetical protein PRIPAC_76716 [Pristionchus pacificus]|uniref:Uncharacterized protein n=1 Tax=Pristionchus pacificus TaxID=54126 RepID=A0A2A6BH92_PRIPA|nr:hypothetical protein PRIPAC_76716 [Pristionchus pacificus]|eukprot:PDM65259.1 hypothetical protein PRIPAC_52201 [Pristionchus pacificus]
MMNEKNDYFRFPLALCPSEKSLTSTFGTWETSPHTNERNTGMGKGKDKERRIRKELETGGEY